MIQIGRTWTFSWGNSEAGFRFSSSAAQPPPKAAGSAPSPPSGRSRTAGSASPTQARQVVLAGAIGHPQQATSCQGLDRGMCSRRPALGYIVVVR